jgi:hypothetical protein
MITQIKPLAKDLYHVRCELGHLHGFKVISGDREQANEAMRKLRKAIVQQYMAGTGSRVPAFIRANQAQ